MSQEKTDPAETIAQGLDSVARALVLLGNAGATSAEGGELGAIEFHGVGMSESIDSLSEAVSSAGSEICDGLNALAEAVLQNGREQRATRG